MENSLKNEVFNSLNYLGLHPDDMVEDYNLRGSRQVGIYFKFGQFSRFDSPQEQISKICDPFYDNIANSPYIRHIKHSHQKEVQSLKEEIKRLQKLNMNLSEGISNGAEYLEMHCDGVKEVKVEG